MKEMFEIYRRKIHQIIPRQKNPGNQDFSTTACDSPEL